MNTIMSLIKREDGATAIEYALIAAGIAVVIIAAVNLLGVDLSNTFSQISCSLSGGTWNSTTNVCG